MSFLAGNVRSWVPSALGWLTGHWRSVLGFMVAGLVLVAGAVGLVTLFYSVGSVPRGMVEIERARDALANRALYPLPGPPLPFYARDLSLQLAATPLASCPPQAAPARGAQVDELNARAPGWRAVDARVIRPNPANVADYRRVRALLQESLAPRAVDAQLARVEVALGCDLKAPFTPDERMAAYLKKLRALQD